MEFENGFFFQGDCLAVLDLLPDKCAHMVLADLPYGKTRNTWDCEIPLEPLWQQLNRVCSGAIVLTAMQPFSSRLISSNPKGYRHCWVWAKNKATGHLNAKRMPLVAHEDILVFGAPGLPYYPQMREGAPRGGWRRRAGSTNYGGQIETRYDPTDKRYPTTVLNFPIMNNDDTEKWHPTQKPVDLFEYLIRTYSKEGETVLDVCAGAGTTAIAAARSGRRWLCVEKDPEYFARAVRSLHFSVDGSVNRM